MNSFFNVQSGMDMYGNAVEQADDGDGDGYDYGDYDEGENILGGGEDDLSSLGFTVVKGG
jgi:hypothetical protein